MRVVLAIRTRDQADLVDAFIAFHLHAGVDFVIATDHRSTDGTDEVIERYERAGYARLLRDPGEQITLRRSEMARLAAIEHAADWVLHADGDEAWWPRGGSIRDVLEAVPERYGIVRAAWQHFAPRPDDARCFAERMTVRIRPSARHTRQADPFHAQVKVAHRAHRGLRVTQGAHDVAARGLVPLRSWFPFEVLHFPIRSSEQARRKYELLHAGLAGTGLDVSRHVEQAHARIAGGAWEETYRSWLVDDAALERGRAEETLALDTRLRDALRTLAGVEELDESPSFPLPGRRALVFDRPTTADAAAFASDTQPLHDLDAETRIRRRVEAFERRLAGLGPG